MGWKHKACISLEVQRGLKIKRRSGGKGFADPNTFFFFPKQSKKDHRPRASWAQAPQFHTKQIKFVNCTVCYIFHVDKNPLESIGRKEKEPFYALPLERKGELLDRMTQGVWLTVPTLESLGPERAWKIPGSTGPWHGEGCMGDSGRGEWVGPTAPREWPLGQQPGESAGSQRSHPCCHVAQNCTWSRLLMPASWGWPPTWGHTTAGSPDRDPATHGTHYPRGQKPGFCEQTS